jgi:hypothetical protein
VVRLRRIPLSRFTGIVLLLTLWTACASLPASAQFFANRSTTQLGTSDPISIVSADFNRDGKQDIAIADGAKVWILLGKGDGTFETPVSYTVGSMPLSVAAADLNHDGIPDLVVPDGNGKAIYILIGNGDGTFRITTGPNTAEYPKYAALVDVNGDHLLDLVVIDSPYITVFLNQGNGTFGSGISFKPPEVPMAIAWGDFAGNGKLDLAVAEFEGFGHDVTILLGNGDGTFQQGPIYPVGADPMSVVVADFRGNGKLDLAVGDLLSSDINVLLGNGDGSFQSPAIYPTDAPVYLVTADLDGDGKLDLVAASITFSNGQGVNLLSGGAAVLLGNGDGTFQAQQRYVTGLDCWSVAAADMNGDKRPDLIVGTETVTFGGELVANVLLNTGTIGFSPYEGLTFPAQLIGTKSAPLTATLTNEGTAAWDVSSVTLQGMPFAIKSNCKGSIAPGAHCDITATFTAATEGTVTGTVTLKDSASSKPQVLTLLAAGTVVTFNPPSLTFPAQKVGTSSAPLSVQVTNTGSVALDFLGITNRGNFSQTNTCGSQIGAGASCTISVTFSPTHTGTQEGYVTVNDDGGGSPQRIRLQGTGT